METNFTNYQEFIKTHTNYEFIPDEYKQNWLSVSKKGENPRKPSWDAKLFFLIQEGILIHSAQLSNVARIIHPTKMHVCQCCHKEHSVYYVYPNKNTIQWIKKTFQFHIYDNSETIKTIFEIYDEINHEKKIELFEAYFEKNITKLKEDCYSDQYNGKKLSPGVMANPPDRLDGFHSYNSVCGCRKKTDKGRTDENMKSYIQ